MDFLASSPETAAHRLNKALAAKGIMTIEDGEKLILVLPASEAGTVRPRSSEIKSPAGERSRPEVFPGGVFINFPNSELNDVVKLYADLTGRKMDSAQQLPTLNGTVNFTTQTALSVEECAYALETLLRWHGLKVISGDTEDFKADPTLGAKQ